MFPCRIVVPSGSDVTLRAEADPQSSVVGWKPCGASRTCQLAGVQGVSNATAIFEPTFSEQKRLDMAGQAFGGGELAVELEASGETLLSIASSRGFSVDGVFLGPPGGFTGSWSIMRLRVDGGLAWANTAATGLDAGNVQLRIQQIQAWDGGIFAVGECTGECPPTNNPISTTYSVYEVDPNGGRILRAIPFSTMLLANGGWWPWLPRLGVLSTGTALVDARSGFGSATFVAYPFHVAGGCDRIGESLQCSIWWDAPWTSGSCSALRPSGQRAVGVVTLNAQLVCTDLEVFDSTVPGSGVGIPAGVFGLDAGRVFVGTFTQPFSFGVGLQTPGPGLAFVQLRPQPKVLSTLGLGSSDIVRRTPRHVAHLIRPTSFTARTFFGTLVPPDSSALIRVRVDDLTVEDVTVFENARDVSLSSRDENLVVFLRGQDVRMAGVRLNPDGGYAAHLIRVREDPP